MVQLLGQRIEDDGDAGAFFDEEGQRDAGVRNAMDEVAGAVDRIDDPSGIVGELDGS